MYALVLSENKMASELLCRNLTCENILCESKTVYENYQDYILFNNFDCIIYKLTNASSRNLKVLSTLNDLKFLKPIFLLINKNQLENIEISNITTRYIYPEDIPTRFLANEIKKIINRFNKSNMECFIKVHDVKLDINKRVVERYGEKSFLRNKEFQLLEYLMRNTDTLLSRQLILENVWDRNAYFITNTVDVHINSLRKKIDYKKSQQLIETVYCSGYIFHSKPSVSNHTTTRQ